MSKLEKLLTELITISYANMAFNTLLAKSVVAALLKSIGKQEIYNEEIDKVYEAIDEYASKLNKILEDKPDGR